MAETQRTAFYGSLYMERGETYSRVQRQLDYAKAKANCIVAFYFDISCKPTQKKRAQEIRQQVLRAAKEILPHVDPSRISCSLAEIR